jgi:hypothetical protein
MPSATPGYGILFKGLHLMSLAKKVVSSLEYFKEAIAYYISAEKLYEWVNAERHSSSRYVIPFISYIIKPWSYS